MSRPGEDGNDHEVRFGSLLTGLESATNRAESPIRRFVGSNRLNPLPHAGTISVFLLIVVIVTGLYITLFFEFGYEASYSSVVGLEGHPIQRAMRSIHRVSSAMLVVTTIIHGWRTFVAKRFTSSRRFRWLTGMLALVIVWLAGVTGYWLIWDVRAQAINETLASVVSPIWPSAEVSAAVPTGSGWLTIFLIWLAHLGLTAVVGWALWRHLRAAKFDWLPPYRWMWAMGGAIVVAGIAFPSGLLAAADPNVARTELILDPYVMFLLPVLVSPWGLLLGSAAIVIVVALSGLPWAVRRADPPTAVISESACTGCELCVIDCPYLALSMTPDGSLAVVDEDRCVGCGICLGSCAFGAITGLGDVVLTDGPADADVIVVCARELRLAEMPAGVIVKEVECTGAVNPLAVGEVAERGGSVHVIGCAPGECSYRTGNVLASGRMTGERQPMVPRKWQSGVTRDWAAPDDIRGLIEHPGAHEEAGAETAPVGKGPMARMAVVVLVSVLVVGATSASLAFESPAEDAEVRIVVNHREGALIEGGIDIGRGPLAITVRSDGDVERFEVGDGPAHVELIDVVVPPRLERLEVRLEAETPIELFDGPIDLDPGTRLVLTVIDAAAPPSVTLGRQIFEGAGMSAQAGCQICHSLEPGRELVGPPLAGVGAAAGNRVPGQSASQYLRESILAPDAYVVEGYRAGQMLPIYQEQLTDDEIDALIGFLLTLRGS